jgi:APA family basic amino acid/polyamine antiporter
MSGARVPFSMARDGYFFKSLASVHPRFHSPSGAIIVQAALAITLMLAAASFKELLELAIYSEWLIYMLAAATIFVFRVRDPDALRPYKCWGYPVVPALFVLASGVLLYFTFMENVRNSLIGTLVILGGLPIYFYFRSRRTV